LRVLDEAGMAFRVVQEKSGKVQGWLRTMRREMGITVMEMAKRMGVSRTEVFRSEDAEERGVIELQTLRRAAEALGCDLVYGLAPKEGTLAAKAAVTEAGREQRREEAWARKLQKAKDQRTEAARVRWKAHEKERLEKQWAEYWRRWERCPSPMARQRLPKPGTEVRFWKYAIRKALARTMRKNGMRVR